MFIIICNDAEMSHKGLNQLFVYKIIFYYIILNYLGLMALSIQTN